MTRESQMYFLPREVLDKKNKGRAFLKMPSGNKPPIVRYGGNTFIRGENNHGE